jgi:hypothetical protein
MRDFLLAIVFLVGTVLLLGGCLYHDKLLSAEGASGLVLCCALWPQSRGIELTAT